MHNNNIINSLDIKTVRADSIIKEYNNIDIVINLKYLLESKNINLIFYNLLLFT